MLGDLRDPRWIYLKGALFVVLGLFASALLLAELPTIKAAALLSLAIWAFARAYYFAFCVVEQYVDPSYRYRGIGSFIAYLLGGRNGANPRGQINGVKSKGSNQRGQVPFHSDEKVPDPFDLTP